MKYWWVNHKQTASQEISGGYLWSPKTEKNGARSQFYDNMRRTRPGDIVYSYANSNIGHIGRVADFAINAAKPEEFGKTGSYWGNDGWLVPVSWTKMKSGFKPKDHLSEISPYLPEKYSPIQASTGNGNQKAYLAEIPIELSEYIVHWAEIEPEQLASQRSLENSNALRDSIENHIEQQISEEVELDETEKLDLIRSRRGQGSFRRKVEILESKCRVTGLSEKSLLVASHIKPWRSCSTGKERLDGANGLLLAPHIDKLFDRGLITFGDKGDVQISESLESEAIDCLGLKDALASNVGEFSREQARYLDYHRKQVFVG